MLKKDGTLLTKKTKFWSCAGSGFIESFSAKDHIIGHTYTSASDANWVYAEVQGIPDGAVLISFRINCSHTKTANFAQTAHGGGASIDIARGNTNVTHKSVEGIVVDHSKYSYSINVDNLSNTHVVYEAVIEYEI